MVAATGLTLGLGACVSTVGPAPPPTQGVTPPPVVSQPLTPAAPAAGPDQGRIKVALLVPLSGTKAEIGTSMLEAAQLAVFEVADDHFQLLPRDTHGTAQGAAEAARDAVAAGARLILGPVFRDDALAARPSAQAAGIGMLTFSNDASLAGGGVYVLGQTPADQVRRVVSYAHAQGLARFAALAPRSAFGDQIVAALTAATQSAGVQPPLVQRYDSGSTDLRAAIAALTAAANGGPPPFDALMIAEGGERLRTILPQLTFLSPAAAPSTIRLLGTAQWDDPALANEPLLAGGWYATAEPGGRAAFEDRFQAAYGHKPIRIAPLAYDATALAAVLARGQPDHALEAGTLVNPNGFAGVDGIFRLRPDGLVDRGLAVMEIAPGGAHVVDPAPRSFETVGY